MPRSYAPYTPAGDPVNPVSLVSQGVEIPQVNFTAQTAVAQPENQFEILQRVIGEAAGVATSAMRYEENRIKNEIAIDRINKRNAEEKKENEREEQANVIATFDSLITSNMLKGTEEGWAEAQRLGDQFSSLYPVGSNPFMSSKAQDQLVRIQNGKRIWQERQEVDYRKEQDAARIGLISPISLEVERLESLFSNPETRSQIMGQFAVELIGGKPFAVPDERLHVALNNYLMNIVGESKLNLTDERERTQLNEWIIGRTSSLRNSIIGERNKRRTYGELTKLSETVTVRSSELDLPEGNPTDRLDGIFELFDEVRNKQEAGFISERQASDVIRNFEDEIVMNAGRNQPVAGALKWARIIAEESNAGKWSSYGGTTSTLVNRLLLRASKELDKKISDVKLDAKSNKQFSEDTSLYEAYPREDPALSIGLESGILEINAEGVPAVVPGMDRFAIKLNSLSQSWESQKIKKLNKDSALEMNRTFDRRDVIDEETTPVNLFGSQGRTPEALDDGIVRIATREYRSAQLFRENSDVAANHAIAVRRSLLRGYGKDTNGDGILDMPDDIGVWTDEKSGASTDLNGIDAYAKMKDAYQKGDVEGLQNSIEEFYQSNDFKNKEYGKRLLNAGLKLWTDLTLTEGQKEVASGMGTTQWTDSQMQAIQESEAVQLKRTWDRMNSEQQQDRLSQISSMSRRTDSFSPTFIDLVGEKMFAEGSSEEQLRMGYEYVKRSRSIYRDAKGVPVAVAPRGQEAAEVHMFQNNELMYRTIIIAENKALMSDDPNDTPEDYLLESHRQASARMSQFKNTEAQVRRSMRMLPGAAAEPGTNLLQTRGEALYAGRANLLRDEIVKQFGEERGTVGRVVDASGDPQDMDPLIFVSWEDQVLMNTTFEEAFLQTGSETDAMHEAVSAIRKRGYVPVIQNNSVNFVFDPRRDIEAVQSSIDTYPFRVFVQEIIDSENAKLGKTRMDWGLNNENGKPSIEIIIPRDRNFGDEGIVTIQIRREGRVAGKLEINVDEWRTWNSKPENIERMRIEQQRTNPVLIEPWGNRP